MPGPLSEEYLHVTSRCGDCNPQHTNRAADPSLPIPSVHHPFIFLMGNVLHNTQCQVAHVSKLAWKLISPSLGSCDPHAKDRSLPSSLLHSRTLHHPLGSHGASRTSKTGRPA